MEALLKPPHKKTLFLLIMLIILLMNFLFSSCGTARRGEPLIGKMEERSRQVSRGELVFMHNCQKCHPGGEAGVGMPINNLPLPGFAKRLRVRSRAFAFGIGRMPSFKKHEISRDQMDDLIVYLNALKNKEKTSD